MGLIVGVREGLDAIYVCVKFRFYHMVVVVTMLVNLLSRSR